MEAKEDFRLFKRTYRDRHTGDPTETDNWYIEFRDHLNVRHRWPAFTSERQTHKLAEKLVELVGARRSGEPLTEKQSTFIETITDDLRERMIEATIIDRRYGMRGGPLLPHLQGDKDEDGKIVTPGYRQALEAKGDSAAHVEATVNRAKRIIDSCAFVTVADLRRPGAVTEIQCFLGKLRDEGELNGSSVNKHIKCVGAFVRWLVKDGRLPSNPLTNLERVNNADIDADQRRELLVDEVRWLLDTVLKLNKVRLEISAEERERLYRFAYSTGMRPGQIRCLTKSSFNLDGNPPIVTSAAATVKRRKIHEQVLTPDMAAELKDVFSTMMPSAKAFTMPTRHRLAGMLRQDMADARKAWIEAAGKDVDEQVKRQQSDFLADVDHRGGRADFYSLRHAHASALADAGVPQRAIQESMHHTSGATTERYLHTRKSALAAAIGQLPIVKPTRTTAIAQATGTDGKVAGPPAAPTVCASVRSSAPKAKDEQTGKLAIPSQNRDTGVESDDDATSRSGGTGRRAGLRIMRKTTESHEKTQGSDSAAPPAGPNPTPMTPEVAEIAE